jgi:cytochrome c biogenesis protein CcdA/thiol-disulfide isomerase/thioredoxin
VIVLLLVGFAAGFVTAISPCVLPVLPLLFAGGATGGTRRPYAIIAGLIASFSAFTLGGAWLLDQLGLPKDFLRDVAIALLFLLAATLVFPRLGDLIQRPLYRLARRPRGDLGGGLLLGASLGLVFVPCAGPVLAVITVAGATQDVGGRVVLLTTAYAVGAAVPMLLIALGGRWAGGMKALRPHAEWVRRGLGVAFAATALAIALNVDRHFQTAIPGYTEALQERFEESDRASRELDRVRGRTRLVAREGTAAEALPDYGRAPEFAGVTRWLNTPGGRALSLSGLRGRVVLVDFWTYSCINCLRTLPHLKAWDRTYRREGLAIVGVHSPEFAFEQETGNVRAAIGRLGLRYPVAMDNAFETWDAYQNRYWPAKYLIDKRGRVRYAHFGEGAYGETESHIRRLLGERTERLPGPVRVTDRTPRMMATPETYLGHLRLSPEQFVSDTLRPGRVATYRFPRRPLRTNEFAYAGQMRVEPERIVAGPDARLRLRFRAQNVFLVLAGRGSVKVLLDGKLRRTVRVSRSDLHTILSLPRPQEGLLELRFTPGVSAYAFTFG